MSTHLQNSLFRLVVRLFYLIRADFVMIVVMVMGMFTGIFGKITIGMGFKFTHSWRSRNKVGGPGIECCAPCRAGWPSRTRISPYAIRGPRPGIMSAQKQSGCCVALHCHFSVTLLMHTEASSVFRVCHGCGYTNIAGTGVPATGVPLSAVPLTIRFAGRLFTSIR